MSKRNPERSVKRALVSELTLQPRSAGQTTESAYRQSLEASPSYQQEMARVTKKGSKRKKRKQ